MATRRFEKRDRVGDWILVRPLGEGGQAPVWEVRYAESKHSPPAAMKLCYSDEDSPRARFEREILVLDEYRHEGIVALRDRGTQNGVPFFVMERANATMQDAILNSTAGSRLLRSSPAIVLTLFRQVAAGVAFLHDNDVLHRDIKPANVLLMLDPPEPMRAVISDVGIAAKLHDQGAVTKTHEVVGTPGYRAPETAVPGGHMKASDVYSLGKTLEFILTGQEPHAVGPTPCRRSADLTDDLWDRLDAVLSGACSFDPKTRFSDAREFLANLPVPIIACAESPRATAHRGSPTLDEAERIMLAAVIGCCPTPDASVSPNVLRRDAHIVSALTEYRASIALRWLREAGLIETVSVSDYNDNTWTELRPTGDGVLWAREHSDEMAAVTKPNAPPGPGDDDIPF